jgi:acetyl-CoA carboxylase biotin carboxyl carrier protein
MDLRKLKKLIDLVEESSITELEINDAEERVRIVKHGGGVAHQAYAPAVAPAAPAAATAAAAVVEVALPEGDPVKAPMVGTFYRSASPGSEPLSKSAARQGRRHAVHHRGDEAAQRDRIRQGAARSRPFLVENGQPVEYGEPLFIIG